jgi:hypothetical protein
MVHPTLHAERLKRLLEDAKALIPPDEFGGFGVILYSSLNSLPVLPMCGHDLNAEVDNLPDAIARASKLSNPCHDGFHLVSQEGVLTHTNQYLAPPLNRGALTEVKVDRPIGARYLSALLGSKVQGVFCTGIVNASGILYVFEDGRQVDFS